MQGILFKFLAYTVVQGFLAYMYVFNQKSILNTVNQRFQISGSMVHTDRIHCSTEVSPIKCDDLTSHSRSLRICR